MRGFIILSMVLLMSMNTSTYKMDIEYIRANYTHAISDRHLCEMMINDLEQNKSNHLQLAYLGALQTIWANHTDNPLKKLKTFKKGRLNIEKAAINDLDNPEIRFLRYSVQKNAPGFLGYSQNIKEDRNFLKLNVENVSSMTLKRMIQDILKD